MEHDMMHSWKKIQFIYGDGLLKILKKKYGLKKEYTDSEVNRAIHIYLDKLMMQ